MKVSLAEQITLFTQLEKLLGKNFTLEQCLSVLGERRFSKKLKIFLEQLHLDIKQGRQNLTVAYEKDLDYLYARLLAFGIAKGCLKKSLQVANAHIQHINNFKKQLKQMLFYPAILTFFTLGLLFIMFVFIFPKMAIFFNENGYSFTPYEILNRVKSILFYIFFLLAGFFMVMRAVPLLKDYWKKSIQKAFFSFKLIKDYYLQLFLRYLGIFLEIGFCEVEALVETNNLRLPKYFLEMRERIIFALKQGGSLSAILAQESIPLLLKLQLTHVATKEELALLFQESADFVEEEWHKQMVSCLALAEPMLIVFCGALVGLAALTMLYPFLQISSQLM